LSPLGWEHVGKVKIKNKIKRKRNHPFKGQREKTTNNVPNIKEPLIISVPIKNKSRDTKSSSFEKFHHILFP